MLRTAKGLGLTLSLLFLMAVPAAAQDGVVGDWIFTMSTPEGVMDLDFAFAHEGDELTGTADIPIAGGSEISDASYEDGTLVFLLHVDVEGQWFTVEMEAQVEGDEMSGEGYMAEFGAMPFTAKRAESD